MAKVVFTLNFHKFFDDVIFIPGVSFNFILCVKVEIICLHSPPQRGLRYANCLQDIRYYERQHENISTLWVQVNVMKQTNPSNHAMSGSFFVFLFILFSAFILSSKRCYFHFPSALHEKSQFDLVYAIVKIKSIAPPETITDAMGQTIRVMKRLAYNNISSVTIYFFNEFCDVPQKEKTYAINYLQIKNFHSERFFKTTERTKIEINESATIDIPDNFAHTETTIYNQGSCMWLRMPFDQLKQFSLSKGFNNYIHLPWLQQWSHARSWRFSGMYTWTNVCKRLLHCQWQSNGFWKKWKIDQSQFDNNIRIIAFMLWAT